MSETISFGLEDFPQLDVKVGATVSIKIEGKVVSRDANAVEVSVETKDIQTENRADKELRGMTGGGVETAEGHLGEEVDW